MKLTCLKDTCPETGRLVDMLRCCGAHAWSKPCKYYGKKPWSEYRYTTCEHPSAWFLNQEMRDQHLMTLDVNKEKVLCYQGAQKPVKTSPKNPMLAELLNAIWEDNSRKPETVN